MKLIIEIPEEEYNAIKGIEFYIPGRRSGKRLVTICLNSIANGTPLEAIKTDVHRHKMDFYPSDYTLINTLIDKWINKGVDI